MVPLEVLLISAAAAASWAALFRLATPVMLPSWSLLSVDLRISDNVESVEACLREREGEREADGDVDLCSDHKGFPLEVILYFSGEALVLLGSPLRSGSCSLPVLPLRWAG